MKSNLNLNWLRTFEAAARLSGFSAAARELGLTQVAVSQQIKSLETKLGHDLFVRHPHATYGLFGSDINRTIVVRASIAVLTWLSPGLIGFRQQFPNIKLKFVTSIWPDPVDTQKVDIDIVLMPSHKQTEVCEKLSDEFIVPICGAQTGMKYFSLNDLRKQDPIHIVGYDDHWSRYMNHFEQPSNTNTDENARIQVDTSIQACELVASGMGCAVLIERFARRSIEAGKAIRIVGEPIPLHQSHFLVRTETGNEQSLSAEIEVFKQWIRTEFSTRKSDTPKGIKSAELRAQ